MDEDSQFWNSYQDHEAVDWSIEKPWKRSYDEEGMCMTFATKLGVCRLFKAKLILGGGEGGIVNLN